MADKASTACSRCRAQKLRCSREQPECARCMRVNAECSYPHPPDRKLLASLRAPAKRKRPGREYAPPPASTVSPPELSPSTNVHTVADYIAVLPSRHIQNLLQELFFIHTFNSSLIFHRPTFNELLKNGRLPISVLLAVCATGIRFITPESTLAKENDAHLRPLGDFRVVGKQWALWAGKECLKKIDQPTLTELQACQVLALYWFAVGDFPRNTMFADIAYSAARTLGPDKRDVGVGDKPVGDILSQWISSETARRCFWAAWIMRCVLSDGYAIGSSADTRVLDVPVPTSDESFYKVVWEGRETLSNLRHPSKATIDNSEPRTTSVMGEFIKVILHWANIRDHIVARKRTPFQNSLTDLFTLDQTLLDAKANLPQVISYSKRALYQHLVINQQHGFVELHAGFLHARIALHASVVPYFSGRSLPNAMPVEMIRASARIALNSANELSELGADILALEWDPARLAPFVGHCMYISASIQVALIFSKDSTMASKARHSLLTNLKVLDAMRPFWTKLELLWERIHLLHRIQSRKASSSASKSGISTVNSSIGFRYLDQVVCIERNNGQLETLGDSLLDYGVRGAQEAAGGSGDSQLIKELEGGMHLSATAQLMQGSDASIQQANQHKDYHDPPTESIGQAGVDMPYPSELDPFDSSQQLSYDLLLDDTNDWSKWDLDMIPSTMFSLDDLLGGTGA